ncbi:MAG: aminopeptidase [Clostridia bacterium]|nr:aminopeptidase [Clostridia bacterium]MBR5713310.1 aminopeptidase [Clostridia bacterium]
MNFETISKLVKASGVTEGELILIHFWGEDADKGLANSFMEAVVALGASGVLLQQARTVNRDIFSAAKSSSFNDKYFELFSKFDAVLDIFAYQPVILGYKLDDGHMELYRKYVSRLFYKLMGCKRFTQIRIPTKANAAESNLEPDDYIRRMERAYDINYEKLAAECRCKVEAFSCVEKVAVTTGEDCVLSMELQGRKWMIDAGDGDLPCGEIYIAPVESKTNGRVFFETLWLGETKYTDVTLEVVDGEITGSNNEAVAKRFAEMSKQDRTVCELGLGMNPNIEELCGYTLLDEKATGTFHIAVGANNMFGGMNEASDHIDFVGRGKVDIIK